MDKPFIEKIRATKEIEDQFKRDKMKDAVKAYLTEPGRVLLKEVGTFGSSVGEPEIRAIEGQRAKALEVAAAMTTSKKLDPKDAEIVEGLGGKKQAASVLKEVAEDLGKSATQARNILSTDSIAQRIERSAMGLLDSAKDSLTAKAKGDDKEKLRAAGVQLPVLNLTSGTEQGKEADAVEKTSGVGQSRGARSKT